MKKFATLLILLFTYIATSMAQDMSVLSFEEIPNDMDARINYPKQDRNGGTAAIIKVITTEKGFSFDVGMLGVVDVVHDKVAQTWLYVPKGIIRLTIEHAKLGRLKYEIPREVPIKEATVYELVLTTNKVPDNNEESAGGHYLLVTTDPADAEISIDGGESTPIPSTGIFLTNGTHTYRVQARLHQMEEGTVTMADQRIDKEITLTPRTNYL